MTKTPEELAEEHRISRLTSRNYSQANELDLAYLAGYEAGLRADKWISVKEKLPEESGKYYATSQVYVDTNEFDSITKRWDWGNSSDWMIANHSEEIVTHWTNLPEPPKEEK